MYEQQAFKHQEKQETAQTLGASKPVQAFDESTISKTTVEITDTGQNRADIA